MAGGGMRRKHLSEKSVLFFMVTNIERFCGNVKLKHQVLKITSQEQSKFALFLKWLILPIIASTIATTCVPAD